MSDKSLYARQKGLTYVRSILIVVLFATIALIIIYFNKRSEMNENTTILIRRIQRLINSADHYYQAHCNSLPNSKRLSIAQLFAEGYLTQGAFIVNPFDLGGRYIVSIENIGNEQQKFYQIRVTVTFPNLSKSKIKAIQKATKAQYHMGYTLGWFSLPSYYHTQVPTTILNNAHVQWLAEAERAQRPQQPDFVTFLGNKGMSIVNVCPR